MFCLSVECCVSAAKHLRAILLLPFTVTLVVPTVLIFLTRSLRLGWGWPFPMSLLPLAFGVVMIALGLMLLIKTIALFVSIGQGTLSPWDATRKLVVVGPYRYVRNPMITGVFAILLGEAALLGSRPVLVWFGVFVLVNMIYMPLSEERGLEKRFGEDYRMYKANVPRWLPRLTPWQPPDQIGR
jgi:protein-S-isoprenylcysteine O-methyltransferase Ste14